MKIRPATYDDIPDMLPMGKAFYEATGLADVGLNYDEGSLEQYMASLVDSDIATMFVVRDDDGTLMGGLACAKVPWYLDFKQSVVMEQWWWVDEEFRQRGAARALMTAMDDWAEEIGATHALMGDIGTGGAIGEYYKKKGFVEVETHYYKRLQT